MSDVHPALVRQWRLLRLLSARPEGLSLRELAREVDVSQKTIHRDLQLFQRAGFPLQEIVGSHGVKHWRIGSPGGEIPLGFTFDEALAMYLGWQSLQPLGGTWIAEAAERAFQKLRASFGPRVIRYLEKMRGLLHDTEFGVTDYGPHAEILDQLMIAIEEHRVVFQEMAHQPAIDPAARRQPAGRTAAVQHRRTQTLDPQLRPRRRSPGAAVAARRNRRRAAANVNRV